jgi:lysophospholipase L1-like esterase
MRNNPMQKWLVGSILVNVGLVVAGAHAFVEQGGGDFLRAKVYEAVEGSPYTEAGQPFYESGVYRREVSIYERLPLRAGDVVFLGDEQVAQGPWSEVFSTLRVRNRGIVGETTEALERRIAPVIDAHPAAVFISIGRNDLSGGRAGAEEVAMAVRGVLERIVTRAPNTEVYLLSALPCYGESDSEPTPDPSVVALNERLEPVARDLHVTFVDTAAASCQTRRGAAVRVGRHLGGAGYAPILQAVRPHVEATLGATRSLATIAE